MSDLEKKVNDLIGCYCPNCKKETCFSYIGKQKLNVEHLMYNCDNCNSTFSESRIKAYTIERAVELGKNSREV